MTPTMEAKWFLNDDGVIVGELLSVEDAFAERTVAPSYKNFINYAVALRIAGDPEEAKEQLAHALRYGEGPEVWHNLSLCCADLGEFFGSYLHARRAMDLVDSLPSEGLKRNVASQLAYARMRLGMFDEETWANWEYGRYNVSWRPLPGTERWDGVCKKVTVIPEGGYGDAFLFRRWLPLLKSEKHVEQVRLVLWEGLVDWCDWGAYGVDEVIPIKPSDGAPRFDVTKWEPGWESISWMSLPGIMGMRSWADVPRDSTGRKTKIGGPYHHRIGLCWRAEENGSVRKVRSLSSEQAQAIIEDIAGSVYSLVPQRAAHLHLPSDQNSEVEGIVQNDAAMASWRKTTEHIASMDYVVTVDTAVLHLCGLLEVPTLALIPLNADWKFASGQHLYSSMEIFQNRELNWEVDRICETLRARLA